MALEVALQLQALRVFQLVFQQLFHWWLKQVKQRLFVNGLGFEQVERKLAQVFGEDGRIAGAHQPSQHSRG